MNKERIVSVATVSQHGLRQHFDHRPGILLEKTIARMNLINAGRLDVVCLPECFAGHQPQAVPGPITEAVCAWAKGHVCYVVMPLIAAIDGQVTNSAFLVDRTGQICGRYDKVHLTEIELQRGIRPGEPDPPVFRTDFGTIGIEICFDVNWQEGWARLKEKGADIVFWPSAYPGARLLSAFAWMHEYYTVSATMARASVIYDISGEPLAHSSPRVPYALAILCLGKRVFEEDWQEGRAAQLEQRFGSRIGIRRYADEDWFTLESHDPDLRVADIMREFGLVPRRQLLERSARAVDAARAAGGARG